MHPSRPPDSIPDTWVFDVDGCIIDSLTGTSLRPGARELLEHLRASDRTVLLWSAGGATYARHRAEQQSIDALFDRFCGKDDRDEHRRYRTAHLAISHTSVVFVDDRPEDMPVGADVVAVSPYLAHSPYDTGLRKVADRAGLAALAAPSES